MTFTPDLYLDPIAISAPLSRRYEIHKIFGVVGEISIHFKYKIIAVIQCPFKSGVPQTKFTPSRNNLPGQEFCRDFTGPVVNNKNIITGRKRKNGFQHLSDILLLVVSFNENNIISS